MFVDIFILHTCPDNTIRRYWQYFWAKYLIVKGLANKVYERRSGALNFMVRFFKILPKRFLLAYGLKQVYRFRDEKTEFLCNFLGKALMRNGRYKSAYFATTKRRQFETIELNVAGNVEDFLKDRFGDYTKISDIGRIRYEQHALEWDVEKPFKPRKEGLYTDEKYFF